MLDKFVNIKLFTVANIVAIGAIIFFWSAISYALTVETSSGS
jgi:hypothetical protein